MKATVRAQVKATAHVLEVKRDRVLIQVDGDVGQRYWVEAGNQIEFDFSIQLEDCSGSRSYKESLVTAKHPGHVS